MFVVYNGDTVVTSFTSERAALEYCREWQVKVGYRMHMEAV